MKLQAIKKCCNDQGSFLVLNAADGRQWLSNGAAAWPVEGIRITKEAIPAIFDIPQKKLEGMHIDEAAYQDPRFTIEPQNDTELQLEELGSVLSGGSVWTALKNDRGLVFINADYLKPVASKTGHYTYMERWDVNRGPLVAVYDDFFVGALIMPVYGQNAEGIITALRRIAREDIREGGSDT